MLTAAATDHVLLDDGHTLDATNKALEAVGLLGPESAAEGTGTPKTGSLVLAASIPGRWAAPPAPAMTAFSPRPAAASA